MLFTLRTFLLCIYCLNCWKVMKNSDIFELMITYLASYSSWLIITPAKTPASQIVSIYFTNMMFTCQMQQNLCVQMAFLLELVLEMLDKCFEVDALIQISTLIGNPPPQITFLPKFSPPQIFSPLNPISAAQIISPEKVQFSSKMEPDFCANFPWFLIHFDSEWKQK